MDNKEQETFKYTYSAKQQEEIKEIRKKYAPVEENKLEQLRRLDESVTKKATVRALVLGIIGALILGLGMSLAISDFPDVLGLSYHPAMIIGIIIGLVGLVMVGCAYPLYMRTLKAERERIAPEILKLTDELMK
ncbi:MAG: hypothetical protein ACI39R_09095 [Lachnospiraceae bacterium]